MAEQWKLVFSGCELCAPNQAIVKYCGGSFEAAVKQVNMQVDDPEAMNIEKGCIYDRKGALKYSYVHNAAPNFY